MSRAVLFVSAFGAGCSSSGDTLCERLDECNRLNQAVAECQDIVNQTLDRLTDRARSDCEREIEDCLENQACANLCAPQCAGF